MKQIIPAIKLFFVLTLLIGIAYPIFMTIVSQTFFHEQANGEMLNRKGQIIGSRWIGQKFVSARYFWGRPSAVDHNPLPSGGSNLGPTSEALRKISAERAAVIRKAHELSEGDSIPQDLLFASGSGLDPEISPAAALFQVNRVAKARRIEDKQILIRMIQDHIEKPSLEFIGEPRVNVLILNLALDEWNGEKPKDE